MSAEPLSIPDKLRRNAQRAGIEADDPLMPLIETMAEAAGAARLLTPEAEEELVRRVSASAAVAVDRAAAARTRTDDRTTALAGAAALLVAAGIGSAATWWGLSSQPVPTPNGPLTPAAARVLAMNDLDEALRRCAGGHIWVTDGRRACAVPLWIDAAPVPGR